MTDRTDRQRRRSKEILDSLVKRAEEIAAFVEEENLDSVPMRRTSETLAALEKRIDAQDARLDALQARTDEELAKHRREMASFKALAVKQGIVPDDST